MQPTTRHYPREMLPRTAGTLVSLRSRRAVLLLVVEAVVLAMLLTSCTGQNEPTKDPHSVSAAINDQQTTRVDTGDVSLTMPARSTSGDGRVKLTDTRKAIPPASVPGDTSSAAAAGSGIQAHELRAASTSRIDVRLSGTSLIGRATLARTVPAAWPKTGHRCGCGTTTTVAVSGCPRR